MAGRGSQRSTPKICIVYTLILHLAQRTSHRAGRPGVGISYNVSIAKVQFITFLPCDSGPRKRRFAHLFTTGVMLDARAQRTADSATFALGWITRAVMMPRSGPTRPGNEKHRMPECPLLLTTSATITLKTSHHCRPACFALLMLLLGTSGRALRATTYFGLQSLSSRQSISAGSEGLPGVPILGGNNGGDSPSVRSG